MILFSSLTDRYFDFYPSDTLDSSGYFDPDIFKNEVDELVWLCLDVLT